MDTKQTSIQRIQGKLKLNFYEIKTKNIKGVNCFPSNFQPLLSLCLSKKTDNLAMTVCMNASENKQAREREENQ